MAKYKSSCLKSFVRFLSRHSDGAAPGRLLSQIQFKYHKYLSLLMLTNSTVTSGHFPGTPTCPVEYLPTVYPGQLLPSTHTASAGDKWPLPTNQNYSIEDSFCNNYQQTTQTEDSFCNTYIPTTGYVPTVGRLLSCAGQKKFLKFIIPNVTTFVGR